MVLIFCIFLPFLYAIAFPLVATIYELWNDQFKCSTENVYEDYVLLDTWYTFQFLPRDAMLTRYMPSSSVCPSVRPS